MALSSDESVLAAGDVTGRVLIWRDFAGAVPTDMREGGGVGKRRAEVGWGWHLLGLDTLGDMGAGSAKGHWRHP